MALSDEGRNVLESGPLPRVYIDEGRLAQRSRATTDEVAGCILWLAGPDNTYVTAQTVTSDGGLMATF